jgi:excisionase family DNA binding protein
VVAPAVDRIPKILAFLTTRLLVEGVVVNGNESLPSASSPLEKLVTASELAQQLALPESWIRSEERGGRLPSIRAGRYVRFKLSEVEKALAGRRRGQ